jgi:hypothetical protein
MATTGKPTVPSMEVETGVPILKVMRLQKPDLHMVGYALHLLVCQRPDLILLFLFLKANRRDVRDEVFARNLHVSSRFLWW